VAGRDITDGRASRAIAVDLGIGTGTIWQNTGIAYDVAIAGIPFFLGIKDERPYERATAPFRKEQFDSQTNPGEQSLTGWWLRSQNSFHTGEGIYFYDPLSNPYATTISTNSYRFADSQGVNVFDEGEVTLLKSVVNTHPTTGAVVGTDHQHVNQHARSIQWSGVNGVLLHDEFDVDKIYSAITVSITNKALTSNVATLTTSATHGLTIGMTITITGVDATFNGEYRITSVPTTTTFTYAKTASNVPFTAVSPVGTGVTSPVIHFIDYLSGTDRKVYAICDDGVYAYWITNKTAGGAERLTMFKKPLTGDSTTGSSNPSATGDVTQMFQSGDEEIFYATMEFIKDRIVLCVNNKVYEFPTNTDAFGDGNLVFTNQNINYHYTSVAASGPAIYTAGHSGIYSTIQKYTLTTAGAMPTLTSAVVAAELPAGEIVEKLYYYLGYMCIGTNKGIRVASVNDQDGSLNYGPLIVETSQSVYDFAGRDRFIWAASGIGALDGGLIRVDLGTEIESLRFAYANDLQIQQSTEHYTTGVAFLGVTNRLTFTTAYKVTDGAIYLESPTELVTNGYLTTGYIRYNTLEHKHFKRLVGLGNFDYGSMSLQTVDFDGTVYDVNSYDAAIGNPESTITQPTGPQDAIALRFVLFRDATDTTKGPEFKGYQLKALPANPRNRIIKVPLMNFDIETDKYNTTVGYEGRAFDRLAALETAESNGDIVSWQDFRTGETQQVLIEQVLFNDVTPPDKKLTGFGGTISLTIRTV